MAAAAPAYQQQAAIPVLTLYLAPSLQLVAALAEEIPVRPTTGGPAVLVVAVNGRVALVAQVTHLPLLHHKATTVAQAHQREGGVPQVTGVEVVEVQVQ